MKKGFVGGSFDPVTLGHVDLIQRASRLCDSLTVAVLINKDKQCMFSAEQRKAMLAAATKNIKNVDIIAFDGHMPTFVSEGGFDVVFRGLRNSNDFEYELMLAQLYSYFYSKSCETVYLMTKPELSYISSSIVRQNFSLGADVSGWVGKDVLDLMIEYKK